MFKQNQLERFWKEPKGLPELLIEWPHSSEVVLWFLFLISTCNQPELKSSLGIVKKEVKLSIIYINLWLLK
jgi:hypothetical protein